MVKWLKIFTNRSNNQTAIHLPQRMLDKMPTDIKLVPSDSKISEIRIPKEYFKKNFKVVHKKW